MNDRPESTIEAMARLGGQYMAGPPAEEPDDRGDVFAPPGDIDGGPYEVDYDDPWPEVPHAG
jgi:hypothetical protein